MLRSIKLTRVYAKVIQSCRDYFPGNINKRFWSESIKLANTYNNSANGLANMWESQTGAASKWSTMIFPGVF